MMEFLGALVVIGIFVCWCDLTDSWTGVLRPVHALLSAQCHTQNPWRRKMRPATREDERLTEDEIARRKLGPRGVPGGQDTAKMTPQEQKNIPRTGHFDGHTA